MIKEACEYRVKVVFRVQREIVAGLRYVQNSYRKGIKGSYQFTVLASCLNPPLPSYTVDKSNLMVGSYGPKTEPHVYQTPVETAPSGMMARGQYTVKSKFTDDDKNTIHEWEWVLSIKKDWA